MTNNYQYINNNWIGVKSLTFYLHWRFAKLSNPQPVYYEALCATTAPSCKTLVVKLKNTIFSSRYRIFELESDKRD